MIIEGGKVIQSRRLRHVECRCDFCGKSRMFQEPRALAQKFHFCNKECYVLGMGKGSEFLEVRRRTNIEKYGVASASQLPEIRARKSKIMKRIIAETDFTERKEATNLERYGAKNSYQASHIRRKIKELYGSENPFETEHGKAQIKKTMMARYGVENASALPHVIEATHSASAKRKRAITIRNNGGTINSKIERRFYETLVRLFGVANVERDVLVNGWAIDIYILPLDTYVQFDGVYYHGLNRPLEVIKEGRTPTDKIILKTYKRDLKQNAWFKAAGQRLLRITDKQYSDFKEKDHRVREYIEDHLPTRETKALFGPRPPRPAQLLLI